MLYKQSFNALLLTACLCLAGYSSTGQAETLKLSMHDLQGNRHTIEQYRGKWIVINFWGSYCPPCIKEMPELSRFHDKHKNSDAVVLGINQEDIPEKFLANFASNLGVSFPVFKIPLTQKLPFGAISILPTTYIVDPAGRLIAKQQGRITMEALENYIERKKTKASSDAS